MTFGALALVGLVVAACGGGGGSSSSTSAGEPEAGSTGAPEAGVVNAMASMVHEPVADAASASAAAVVKAMTTAGTGRVIVDSEGKTLYDSHRDNPMLYQFDRPAIPSCYAACAEVWPPLVTAFQPKAVGGAERDLLGTIRRRDGSEQVTYAGHPLYAFAGDSQPGETNGNSVLNAGSEWHALEPDGEEPADQGR
jgi:predicted lipoprotein with Yx(FWY)xxD motif